MSIYKCELYLIIVYVVPRQTIIPFEYINSSMINMTKTYYWCQWSVVNNHLKDNLMSANYCYFLTYTDTPECIFDISNWYDFSRSELLCKLKILKTRTIFTTMEDFEPLQNRNLLQEVTCDTLIKKLIWHSFLFSKFIYFDKCIYNCSTFIQPKSIWMESFL